jgi:carbonic anhydrase/acetyltransferase-like protein (isoleucine patch superfamily)
MRTGSRLLSGASMEQNSMLMEHTLLLSGDIAEENTVYVGWPAKTMEAHKKMMERDEEDEKQTYEIVDCQRCHVAHGSHDIMTARCGHAFCQS